MERRRVHVIRPGDYLTKLADRYQFDPETVWTHERNAGLRADRDDMDLLAPGDLVVVPDHLPETYDLQVGAENEYVVELRRVTVRTRFIVNDEPLAGEPFTIAEGIADCPAFETDGDGYAEFTVNTQVRDLPVFFPGKNLTYQLQIGYLDPATTPSGLRSRLLGLGYYAEVPLTQTKLGKTELRALALTRALAAFQDAEGLAITGEADAATIARLTEVFGS